MSLTLSLPRVTLIDFTLSNARRFHSSMGNPTGVKGLTHPHLKFRPLNQLVKLAGIRVKSVSLTFRSEWVNESNLRDKSS